MPNSKYGHPDEFLKKIMEIESSGGTNFAHPQLQRGIHAGSSAIGRYGLMPNTVKEVINRRRLEDTMTPDLQDLDNMPPDQMKQYLESRPDLEDDLAKGLATHVLRKQQGDEEKAAYSWHQGHNLSPQDIKREQMNDPNTAGGNYVNKFRRVKQLLIKPTKVDDGNL